MREKLAQTMPISNTPDANAYLKSLSYEGFVAAYDYEPKLKDSGNTKILAQLKRTNWYIPSMQELDSLIYDKVFAQCTQTTVYSSFKSYWRGLSNPIYKNLDNGTFGKIASRIDKSNSTMINNLKDYIKFLGFTTCVSCQTAGEQSSSVEGNGPVQLSSNINDWTTFSGTNNYLSSGSLFRSSAVDIAPVCQILIENED